MKHSLFWAAVEATAKAVRGGHNAARSGLSTVGALVDCGIPRQHAGEQWLTEKEAEEEVAEPRLQGCGRCDGPLSVLQDGLCPSCWDYYYLDDDDDESYADWAYTPLPRTYEKCGKCNQDLLLRHYCDPPENSRTNAGATSSRAVEEGLTEETPPVSSVSAAINYRGEQLSWCEYVQPAILDVLADHIPTPWHFPEMHRRGVQCFHADGDLCADLADLLEHREHVAPLIAERLEAVTLQLPEM